MQLIKTVGLAFIVNFAMLAPLVNAFQGDATYFNVGLGSCGKHNVDSDFIVALSSAEANHNAHCGQRIAVHYQGRSVVATVADTCPGCSRYSIDLSPAAFDALANRDKGRIQVTWNYI